MTTVYSKPFLDAYNLIERSFFDQRNPNAKQQRDWLARELRKAGWEVKTETCHFDTATGYFLKARRQVQANTPLPQAAVTG
jgi:hypothetical protein